MKAKPIRNIILRVIRRIIRCLILLLNLIVPKDNDLFIFMSLPDYADNTHALFTFMSSKLPYKRLTWLMENEVTADNLVKKEHIARSYKSVRGFWYFLRACCIITSHNQLLNFKSKKQFYVALWHGMPLKKIEFMEDGTDTHRIRRTLDKINLLTATSDTTSSLLGACFHLESSRIAVTGQPRCDGLFHPLDDDILEVVFKVKKDSKIVLFMPTFRQGYLQRSEGRIFNISNIFGFEDFDHDNFNAFLRSNNIIVFCKLHPFEEELFAGESLSDESRIRLISKRALLENDIDLYRLIGNVDLLITDYSSVYFDYLLLERPIVFTPTDLEEYKKKRGFLLEPYDFWTPGPKAFTQEQLQDGIIRSFKNRDYYRKEREAINDIINHYKDDHSCERVTKMILEKLSREK